MITRPTKSTVTITMQTSPITLLNGFNGMIVKLLYTYYSSVTFQ